MKMVSAAKLKKAQKAIEQMRPYANKLHEILKTISRNLENSEVNSVFTQQKEPQKILVVIIASNRGLAGSFNASISKKAVQYVKTKYASQLKAGNVDFFTYGKQVDRQLKAMKMDPPKQCNHDIFDELSFENVAKITSSIMQLFENDDYDTVEIAYNKFENAATQKPTIEQFLPVKIEKDPKEDSKATNHDFIYEPSLEYIITELIPSSLKTHFYSAFLESVAAEHGARMTAMHQATDNATDLISELTLKFNKARQAAITGEILEIVSGAEALNG